MFTANGFYSQLHGSYLFYEVGKRAAAFSKAHPEAKIIRMGIGDVTRPLVPAVIEAMHKAVDDMSRAETFHGYGPDFGYDFLREVILRRDYIGRGVDLELDEIFVSDGAKCDVGNIQEIFSQDCVVAVTDPVYPVYVDTNVMAGRAGEYVEGKGWNKIIYMPCRKENHFLPELPKERVDLIYLCFPNNPSGVGISRGELAKWVNYALENHSVILYDAAYEAFISEDGMPHSIFEIEGAEQCAIEFRSFSKTAGFTGTRCAFTVIPKALTVNGVSLNKLWNRRQSTKMNGVSYVIQRGAEAVYSEEGMREVKANIAYYLNNAKVIREGLSAAGFTVYGGVNSPYVWLKTPEGLTSWEFFDLLLQKAGIVGTPGSGFGMGGEGYFRLTAFNTAENTKKAVERIIESFQSGPRL